MYRCSWFQTNIGKHYYALIETMICRKLICVVVEYVSPHTPMCITRCIGREFTPVIIFNTNNSFYLFWIGKIVTLVLIRQIISPSLTFLVLVLPIIIKIISEGTFWFQLHYHNKAYSNSHSKDLEIYDVLICTKLSWDCPKNVSAAAYRSVADLMSPVVILRLTSSSWHPIHLTAWGRSQCQNQV